MSENPFERWEIDPREGPRGITEAMRARMAKARTDAERDEIRAAWEALTRNESDRLRAALGAHPETRPPLGTPPPPPPRMAPRATFEDLGLPDLAARPSVRGALADAPEDLPPAPYRLSADPLLE